ncbi:hypothetical protein FB390_3101 [Nocardia bhagyanarayanae]|uniref:Uncharacterized protein n=1 Tax=Nocardia bhagyanarayanae TaxID=1215925 RepID=A0A543FCH9_9NOCA|nr:hypothetical protein FB390_3101 [Nocardia bhagyanarayanae]
MGCVAVGVVFQSLIRTATGMAARTDTPFGRDAPSDRDREGQSQLPATSCPATIARPPLVTTEN